VPGIGAGVTAKLTGLIALGPGGVPPKSGGGGGGGLQLGGDADQEAIFFPDDEAGTGLGRLLGLLEGALQRLDVAVYAIGHEKLASALVAAHKRGVLVRVLTDDVQAKQASSVVPSLREAGIRLRTDASEKLHMHHKFVVVDDGTLLSGSLNWTYAAVKKANENVIISKSASLCRHFSAEFDRLWAAFAAGSAASAPAGRFEGKIAALFWPEASGANVNLLRQELAAARQSIDVAVFTLTLDVLVDLLLEKHQRGVQVRVITDNRQALVPGADAQRLRDAGVPVRTDKSWYAMHHKFAVVDWSTLINGSFNWTAQAAKGNNEAAVVFRSAGALAQCFTKEFGQLWEKFAE